jgi:hypothetical protein
MNRRSQTSNLPIHTHYFIGAWTFVSIRFSKRLLLLDERSNHFLKALVHLGGYCTGEQAQRLGLANSATRVVAHLDPENSGGTNYAVEVWDDKPHQVIPMSEIALTVISIVNKNGGVPALRAIMAAQPPKPAGAEAPAAETRAAA